MWIIVLISALIVAVFIAMLILGASFSAPRYRGPVSDHYSGRTFINRGHVKAKGGLEVVKWMMMRKPAPWQESHEDNFGKHPLAHFRDGIRVTFINHSTFLIQVDGVNILTDQNGRYQ